MAYGTWNRYANAVVAATLAAAALPVGAVVVELDTFTIMKNGLVLFQDTFDDAVAPPVAPGEFASYLYPRGIFVESGGKVTLDSATAPRSVNAAGIPALTTRATFSTNIVDSDTTTGLKSTHTFSVTGVFGLTGNTVASDTYGIRLVDRDAFGNFGPTGSQSGNDMLELRVSHLANGDRVVRFRHQDFTVGGGAGAITDLGTSQIDDNLFASNNQIVLTLAKDSTASNQITASFAFIVNGVRGPTMSFAEKPGIFNGENWTRGEIMAAQAVPIPEPETYAMLLAGLALIGWRMRARRAAARFV